MGSVETAETVKAEALAGWPSSAALSAVVREGSEAIGPERDYEVVLRCQELTSAGARFVLGLARRYRMALSVRPAAADQVEVTLAFGDDAAAGDPGAGYPPIALPSELAEDDELAARRRSKGLAAADSEAQAAIEAVPENERLEWETACMDHSLLTARSIRAALRRRQEALQPAIEAYDNATSTVAREKAASELVFAAERAERAYDSDVAKAVAQVLDADLGAGA